MSRWMNTDVTSRYFDPIRARAREFRRQRYVALQEFESRVENSFTWHDNSRWEQDFHRYEHFKKYLEFRGSSDLNPFSDPVEDLVARIKQKRERAEFYPFLRQKVEAMQASPTLGEVRWLAGLSHIPVEILSRFLEKNHSNVLATLVKNAASFRDLVTLPDHLLLYGCSAETDLIGGYDPHTNTRFDFHSQENDWADDWAVDWEVQQQPMSSLESAMFLDDHPEILATLQKDFA